MQQNIPTDLLRTLATVVDLRSFTKAAQSLGITQPAVSAKIKRLHKLLGYELLDKSAPGVSLTKRGELVLEQARQLLSINDGILQIRDGVGKVEQILRVGVAGDCSGSKIPATLARFYMRWPDIGFIVTSSTSDALLQELKLGNLDLAMAVTDKEPVQRPRHLWMRQPVWVRSAATRLDPDRPVPLVSYGKDCACQRVAVAALRNAGRECKLVYTAVSLTSLAAAVGAGFGVMVMPRARVLRNNLYVWEDAPLPPLPQIYCGIYTRDGGNRQAIEELADNLEADLRVEPQPPVWQPEATVASLRASRGQ